MLGDGTADSLANPPGGIGAETVTAPVVELLRGPHQSNVALLDDVQQGKTLV